MVTVHQTGAYLINGKDWILDNADAADKYRQATGQAPDKQQAQTATMAYRIMQSHNTSGNMEKLQLTFDSMASHDITYVGIVQTARASGLKEFPLPYILTNCHNSLNAVGGTINEDDHVFGLSAAKKYGGVFVPPHQAVIHQYVREMTAGGGRLILGSDSHTRYGVLGTMGVGEGGPELVKQLLGRTYDIDRPDVIAVHLTGKPAVGVGPQDVALAFLGAVFASGYVQNKVLEFVGDGIANLSADYRMGIEVMTTESTALSSIWETDGVIKEYFDIHGRPQDFAELHPGKVAYYDGLVEIDLSKVKPMIAMPFHPSNTYAIEDLNANLNQILGELELVGAKQLGMPVGRFTLRDKVKNGRLAVQQAFIGGCSGGTFENICAAADILRGRAVGTGELALGVYPSSQPVFLELLKNGVITDLTLAGANIRTAFCGPCFGAGDTPANNALSIRHATRNFPNREGAKPGEGQIASVALMDARSIAATVANGGKLTAATEMDVTYTGRKYFFDSKVYENRCYDGIGKPDPETELVFGPNIADWPAMQPLAEHLFLRVCSYITDPVTTTDELIPSGETSSFRSNPIRLAQFTLSRKDPAYVGKTKAVQELENKRLAGEIGTDDALAAALRAAAKLGDYDLSNIGIGGVVYANRPGDGSAREQAASCQKVLGTFANIALEYATKRYRSNLINWGMLPFITANPDFAVDDYIFVPHIRDAVLNKTDNIAAYVLKADGVQEITMTLAGLTDDEREIILDGCLINYYSKSL